MKKILVVFVLFVCSTGAFAQYIHSQGGVVSQGTLVNEKKEVAAARKGFDGWIGIGGGIGGFVVIEAEGANYTAGHFDANFGYNVSPRAFIGAGYKLLYANTTMGAWYANLRAFTSPKAKTSFINLYIGMIHTGTITELNCMEEGNTQDDYSYFKPKGLTGGFSAGYLWNHVALELGFGIFGGLEYQAGSKKVINPYGLDWTDEEVESWPGLELFCKLSWRF